MNVNSYMNEYNSRGEINQASPLYLAGYNAAMKDSQELQLQKKTALTVDVSVTDTVIFRGVLDIVQYLIKHAAEEHQENAYRRLEQLLGETHDIRDFDMRKL